MPTYNEDYIPSYNLFMEQNKQYKDVLSPQEWNDIINILAAQADSTAAQVKKVHDYLISGAAAEIPVSVEEPGEDYNGNLWFKVEI